VCPKTARNNRNEARRILAFTFAQKLFFKGLAEGVVKG